jgi:DNA-binding PadR family transcriptional regulator
VHGYDVRRELLSWSADEWANVAPGSIYHALKKMAEEGLLREVGTEQVGARPARTTYEMTDKGEMVFQELLREYWWEYRQPIDPFQAAFAFLPALPRREAAAALRARAQQLRARVSYLASGLDDGWAYRDKPSHVAAVFQLEIERMEVEAQWCERVADRVDAKEFPVESER